MNLVSTISVSLEYCRKMFLRSENKTENGNREGRGEFKTKYPGRQGQGGPQLCWHGCTLTRDLYTHSLNSKSWLTLLEVGLKEAK